MTTEKREVELIIKGTNLGGKTLNETTTAVKKLSAELDKQVTAAKAGEGSLSALKKTYVDLDAAGKKLIGQDALIGLFRRSADAAEQSRLKVVSAKAAYEALAEQQAFMGKVTRDQDRELRNLLKTVTASEREFTRLEKSLGTVAKQLADAGIDTDNLEDAQVRLVDSARDQVAAYAAAGKAIDEYSQDLRQAQMIEQAMVENRLWDKKVADAAKAREAAKDAEVYAASVRAAALDEKRLTESRLWDKKVADAAKARQAADYVNFWTEALDKADKQEAEFAESRLWDKKVADAAKARQAADYVNFWTEALDKAEIHERRFLDGSTGAYDTKGTKTRELTKRAKELTETYQKLNQTQEEVAASTRKANAELSKNPFQNNGRTTLSLLQRIRGEVLALTGAYVGLQGVISGVNGVLNASKSAQQIQAQLLVANGNDARAAADDYKYLQAQAERLGIFLPVLAKQYAQFGVAAKQANLQSKDMRFVFERVAEAGQVMGLDEENLNGIFNAITQMVSKGKIQTEELRGQLGDRLPGALQFAAKQYKDGVAEFIKQLEKGNVEATSGVINLARGLDEAFNEQFAKGDQNLRRQEGRFKTAVFEFQSIVANSGVTEAYGNLLKVLTDFFRSEDGKAFAVSLADAFKALANALVFVIEHLSTFQSIAEAIIALYLARQFFNMAVGAGELVKSIKDLNKQSAATAGNFAKMEKAFILLSVAIGSFQLGEALQEEFDVVKKIGNSIATFLLTTWTKIKYSALIAFEGISEGFGGTFEALITNLQIYVSQILSIFQKTANAVGATNLAENIGLVIDNLIVKNMDGYKSKVQALTDEMNSWLKAIEEAGKKSLSEADDAAKRARAESEKRRAEAGATADPGGNPAEFSSDPESAANKYKSLVSQVEAVEASALKKQKESIESIIAGIDTQYQELFRKINASGIEGAAQLQVRLRAAVDMLKAEARKNYDEDQLRKIESIQKTFAEIEGQLGRSSLGTLDSRLNAIDSKYKSLYEDIAQLDGQRKEDLKAQLDIMVLQLKVVEQEKFAQDQLKESQEKINNLITERDARIRTVSDLVAAGLKTEAEARELINNIIKDTQPAIEQSADDGERLVESLRGIVDDGTLDMIAAKFELARNSAKGLTAEFYSAQQASEDLAEGLTGAISESAKGFGEAIVGAKSLGDAMRGAKEAFIDFAANFLRKIAEMILQQMILNALQNSGWGGAISGAVNAAVAHGGGIAGSTNRSRQVDPNMFASAPRYHSGGIVGLKANEVGIVAEKNEEVLTTDDPRHSFNGGNDSKTVVVPAPEVKVVNAFDAGSFVSEGFKSKEGSTSFLNYVRANKKNLNAILGS